jgi:hypothetical protein
MLILSVHKKGSLYIFSFPFKFFHLYIVIFSVEVIHFLG